ncbi:MAG: xanthine dehydrogenase family protein molybdopterin-binding subunit, partial [Pseudomonadota bacterium]
EMGQGTTTGLATIIAEELDADWADVKVEFAPANTKIYANLLFGAQGTGGSTAIANSFDQYRQAGAMARDLLVRAAAKTWNVPASEITVSSGALSHASGKSSRFGALVKTATELVPAAEPKLKSPSDYKLIGKEGVPRKDSVAKTNGTANFSIDVKLDDMVYAVVARPPRFGGKVKSFDDKGARAVKGVVDVQQIPQGVVVYAKNTWAAIKGRDALEVVWDNDGAEGRSSDAIMAEHHAKLDEPGRVARNDGQADEALAGATKKIRADFSLPLLAHAPMEPLNCVIRVNLDNTAAEVWDGCQFPSLAQPTIARILGMKPDQVFINTVYAGGSFGRRATPTSDYHAQAAEAVKAIGGRYPVKLMWTREDDLRGGYYRPMFAERIEAGVDEAGKPVAWKHSLAGKSILIGTFFENALVKDGIDSTSVEGGNTLPYAIPNLRVDVRNTEMPIPVLWWRAVGHTHTAFTTEIAIDMLAEAAEQDPVAFRLSLLEKHPRHAGVLKLATEKAGWGTALGKGRGRGVAVHESFNSFVAQVVEVTANADGEIKVDRVVCAVDCGIVINPDVVRAQMEGGVGYGLGAAMRNKITLTDGQVDQENFPDYEPLRISDMPKVEVHIVNSTEKPTGVGEPGVPPIAPALANAIFAATGKRITSQPFTDSDITFAS